MQNEPTIHEPQSLLDVREWKRKASEEIERIGFTAFGEKCRTKYEAFWAELEVQHKERHKAA